MGYSRTELSDIKLSSVKGLAAGFIEKCEKAGLDNVESLLTHYPRRYIDRTKQLEIAELIPGDQATFYATVEAITSRYTRNRKSLVEAVVADSNSRIKVTFFNQPWRAKQLKVGTQAGFFGKLDEYRGNPQIVNPTVDIIRDVDDLGKTANIIPIYLQNTRAELSTWNIRKNIGKVLKYSDELEEILDDELLKELKLIKRSDAFRYIHEPEAFQDARKAARRLRFDEFLMLQMVLVSRYLANENILNAQTFENDTLERAFIKSLPFNLTNTQGNAVDQIDSDMSSTRPMHRLLQGDVGSGKTVVAFSACLRAVGSGAQAIIMSPTEVLANQHFVNAKTMLKDLEVFSDDSLFSSRPVTVELLTNSTTAKDRTRIEKNVAAGVCDIVICTHAMLYNQWSFNNLGLVVIDEQHRFGVEQRSALLTRSDLTPHMLVMTATPIPRTAAMLYFGDLKNTVMDELPKGRKKIKTSWARTQLEVFGAYEKVREEVNKDHQAYVVCPLVNESDKIEAKSVIEHYEHLSINELKGCTVGVIHGQLSSTDKDEVMQKFISGDLDVLISTTVIEVGVDVPNATVMVIEDADRFGLSQLHQLRGRVGRGAEESYCFLCSEKDTVDVVTRLEAMEKTNDGFKLAEIDLELRGSGFVLGGIQSGKGDLKLGKLPRDSKYVEHARDVAMRILKDDPTMSSAKNAVLAKEVARLLDENETEFLFRS